MAAILKPDNNAWDDEYDNDVYEREYAEISWHCPLGCGAQGTGYNQCWDHITGAHYDEMVEDELRLGRPKDWVCRLCDWGKVVRCRSESGFVDHLWRIHAWDWAEWAIDGLEGEIHHRAKRRET